MQSHHQQHRPWINRTRRWNTRSVDSRQMLTSERGNIHPHTLVYSGSKDIKSLDEVSRFSGGREREPESRGGTVTVPPDGAEAGVVALNRADAAKNDRTHFRRHLPPFSSVQLSRRLPRIPLVDRATSWRVGLWERSGVSVG